MGWDKIPGMMFCNKRTQQVVFRDAETGKIKSGCRLSALGWERFTKGPDALHLYPEAGNPFKNKK